MDGGLAACRNLREKLFAVFGKKKKIPSAPRGRRDKQLAIRDFVPFTIQFTSSPTILTNFPNFLTNFPNFLGKNYNVSRLFS